MCNHPRECKYKGPPTSLVSFLILSWSIFLCYRACARLECEHERSQRDFRIVVCRSSRSEAGAMDDSSIFAQRIERIIVVIIIVTAQWQEERIAEARETGYTRTLMGRYRKLPHINSRRLCSCLLLLLCRVHRAVSFALL